MTRFSILLVTLMGLGLLLTAAQAADEPKTDKAAVVKGNTEFALELYHQLRTQEGNLFLSPYSISSALAMTRSSSATGAGTTASAARSNVRRRAIPARTPKAGGAVRRLEVSATTTLLHRPLSAVEPSLVLGASAP